MTPEAVAEARKWRDRVLWYAFGFAVGAVLMGIRCELGWPLWTR